MNRAFTEYSFQTFLSEQKLMAAKCEECGSLFVPPRPLCPHCFNEGMAWVEVSGKGELAAFTAVYIGPNAMIEAGYDRKNPYFTGVVQLEEGPMISAQILGLDAAQPKVSDISTPLTATFIERGEEEEKRTFLAFEVR
ncbi:MAG: Zn-ribbon domain-containing OB-fold protein [Chloroflexi bacterium]|nr:Zn-ribbon domain-containing OB-fold protein [Chloroflexota bacterium]